jgi:hypothetical protein
MRLKVIPIKSNPIKRRRRKAKKRAPKKRERKEHRQHFLVQGIASTGRFYYLHADGKWKTASAGALRYSSVKAAKDAMQLHAPVSNTGLVLHAAQVVPA